jgi:hypothetical protein
VGPFASFFAERAGQRSVKGASLSSVRTTELSDISLKVLFVLLSALEEDLNSD